MQHAVIQGASRGIGLRMTQALLERGVARVHATCRSPSEATQLQALAEKYEQLCVYKLDVTQESTISEAAEQILVRSPNLDLLINTSGILHEAGYMPERRLEDLSIEHLQVVLTVNAIGPLMVIKHLLPGLRHEGRTVVASLSARVGSIGDNHRGGWYGYRSSKAALNQLHKSLSIELSRRAKNTIAVVLHPGSVETDLTRPFRKSIPAEQLFSVSKSVDLLIDVVSSLEPKDHGQFFDYAKRPIDW